jgi:glucose/arabinose dehydrogenase
LRPFRGISAGGCGAAAHDVRRDGDNGAIRRALALSLLTAGLAAAASPADARIRTVDGLRAQSFARGVPNPSNLAFDRRGRLWATSAGNVADPADGVWLVRRRGAKPRQVVSGLFSALGLLWYRGELYVSHVVPNATLAPRHTGRVVAFSGLDGKRFRRRRIVVDGLPTGRHRVDSLAAGPDGRLYLGVGSDFDDRRSSRRLSATVVSFPPRGGRVRVEATGLRNPYGLAFVPGTRRLLVAEHGRDDLGLHRPPEEIDLVRTRGRARWYGFPECWGQGGAPCRGAVDPLIRLRAHSAPGAMASAPSFGRWARSAFVARFGSSFQANPSGGDVLRIALRGRPRAHRLASGFGLQEPLGLAVGPDGALYVSLWTSGRVVRLVPDEPAAVLAAAVRVLPWLGVGLGAGRTSTTAG